MKTTTKTLLIIAILFVIGGMLLAGLGVVMGGTTQFTYGFENGKFKFTEGSNDYVSDTVKVSKFTALNINTDIIDIDISDSGSDYEVYYNVPERFVPVISGTDTLTIEVPDAEGLNVNLFSIGDYDNAKITISIPESDKDLKFNINSSTGDVTVENVCFNGTVQTSTGDIDISDAKLGDVDLITSTGDISYSRIDCPVLRLTTSTGKSQVSDCTIESMISKTQTGDINISDSKVVSLKTEGSTSDIELDDVETDNVDIKVSTGECELDIRGRASDYSCDLSTSTGEIEYDGNEYEKQFTRDGGSKNIIISTSTGDITVDFN